MPKYEGPEVDDTNEEPQGPLENFFFHQRKALESTARAIESLLPPGFREHGTEAGREFAKGFKVLVDAAIDELKGVTERAEKTEAKEEADDEGGDDKPSTTGSNKVKVEVD